MAKLQAVWHWAYLRWLVFWYLLPRGRLHTFGTAVRHCEARHRQRVRRELWELQMKGEIRSERNSEGETVYYPAEKDKN
jgi:hypothetical protein